jgi:hypothetical protein
MAREKGLWEWLTGVLPVGHYSRIESPDTSPGFPDVDYCLYDEVRDMPINGTIELKYAKNPRSRTPFTDKHGMRQSQIIWIRERLRVWGTVWIMAEITPNVLIFDGEVADKINGAHVDTLWNMSFQHLDRRNSVEAAQKLQKLLYFGET